jgi:hypothetical protein
MIARISVIGRAVWVVSGITTNHNTAILTVDFVMARVTVIKLRARFCGPERVAKGRREVDWTLRNEWHSVVERRLPLVEAVPVNRRCGSTHLVDNVDHDRVVLANMHRRARNLPVDAHNAPLDPIGRDALIVEAIACRSNTAEGLSTASTRTEKKDFRI